jgi:GntR family transcriptional regulator
MRSFHMNAPLHEQVRWDLLQRVRRGDFAPDTAIPNEAQLCEEYGVSRITVRRAIGDLCADDILYRRHGVGTFVTDAVRAAQSIKLRGSLSDVLAEDPRIKFKLTAFGREIGDAEALRLLAPDEDIVRLDFRVTLKDEPFALAQIHIPADEFDPEAGDRLDGSSQPILIIAEDMGRTLASANQVIFAGAADPLVAQTLHLPPQSPILQMRRTYFDVAGDVVAVVLGHFHPDRIEIDVKLQLASMDGARAPARPRKG